MNPVKLIHGHKTNPLKKLIPINSILLSESHARSKSVANVAEVLSQAPTLSEATSIAEYLDLLWFEQKTLLQIPSNQTPPLQSVLRQPVVN